MEQSATCPTCGGPEEGYKCNMCGHDMEACDPSHSCGPDTCEPKCANCKEVISKCTCASQGN